MILLILAGFLFIIAFHAIAESPEQGIVTDKEAISEIIEYNAQKYGVSSKVMHTVIKCESSYIVDIVGDSGNSYGLSQIHLPSWRGTITKEEALNPFFAVDFLAKHLSENKGYLWTCYRNNF